MYNKFKKNLYTSLSPARVLIIIGFIIYLPLWLWTIHISAIQGGSVYNHLPVLGSDSIEYATLAGTILERGCFSLSNCIADPEAFRTPGYPLFIAIAFSLFGSMFVVTLVQCLMSLVSGYLIQQILSRHVSYRLSILGMILFVLEPSVVLHSLIVLSDIPYTCIIVIVFFLLIRSKPSFSVCAWIGFLTGISILFRPISMFILPVLVFTYWYMYRVSIKDTVKAFFIMGACICLAALPWVLRNHARTGVFGISSVSSFNLLYYNVPLFLSSQTGTSPVSIEENLAKEVGIKTADWRKLGNSSKLVSLAMHYITGNLLSYTKFHVIKTIPFFFNSSVKNALYSYNTLYSNDFDYQYDEGSVSDLVLSGDFIKLAQRLSGEMIFLVERLIWLVLYTIIFFGLFSKERKIAVVSIVFIFYFGLLTGPVSYARYRLPAEPFMFIALPLGLLVVSDYLKKFRPILQRVSLRK